MLKGEAELNEFEAFVQILRREIEEKSNEKISVFATKEDVAKLDTKITESKVDMIKWMVVTAIALYGVLTASMKFFFHL